MPITYHIEFFVAVVGVPANNVEAKLTFNMPTTYHIEFFVAIVGVPANNYEAI